MKHLNYKLVRKHKTLSNYVLKLEFVITCSAWSPINIRNISAALELISFSTKKIAELTIETNNFELTNTYFTRVSRVLHACFTNNQSPIHACLTRQDFAQEEYGIWNMERNMECGIWSMEYGREGERNMTLSRW